MTSTEELLNSLNGEEAGRRRRDDAAGDEPPSKRQRLGTEVTETTGALSDGKEIHQRDNGVYTGTGSDSQRSGIKSDNSMDPGEVIAVSGALALLGDGDTAVSSDSSKNVALVMDPAKTYSRQFTGNGWTYIDKLHAGEADIDSADITGALKGEVTIEDDGATKGTIIAKKHMRKFDATRSWPMKFSPFCYDDLVGSGTNTTMHSFTVPGGLLSQRGDAIFIDVMGQSSSSASARSIGLRVVSSIYNVSIATGVAYTWSYKAMLAYKTNTTYSLIWQLILNGSANPTDGTSTISGSATWANDVNVDLIITSPAINDVRILTYCMDIRTWA